MVDAVSEAGDDDEKMPFDVGRSVWLRSELSIDDATTTVFVIYR